MLFRGKVADVRRRTTEGFLRGDARLEGLDEDRGGRFEVAFQNEYLVGWRDGAVAVASPDLICLLDAVSGEAVGTEALRYGQRIGVVALPSPPLLRTAEALAQVGPRAFGYDFDWRPIFDGEGPA